MISVADFYDAYLYVSLKLYPEENLLILYRQLIWFIQKKGLELEPSLKNNDLSNQIFQTASAAREESQVIRTLLLKKIGIPKIFQ